MLSESVFAAGTEGSAPKKVESRSDSNIRLFPVATEDEKPKTEDNSENSKNATSSTEEEVKQDSAANYNSSCKLNFIFYFIYKVKYDENGEIGGGSINMEF